MSNVRSADRSRMRGELCVAARFAEIPKTNLLESSERERPQLPRGWVTACKATSCLQQVQQKSERLEATLLPGLRASYWDVSRIRTTSESVWPRNRARLLPSGDQSKVEICSAVNDVMRRPDDPS